MVGRQGLGEPLVVAGQPAEARGPREAAFDDPTTREQDKAAFRFGVFDDFETNPVRGRRVRFTSA